MAINPFSVENKIIVITGCTSGIGRTIAKNLAEFGAFCILIGRNEQKLNELKEELVNKENHYILKIDLKSHCSIIEESIKFFFEKNNFNKIKIDGFVHSAGIEVTKPFQKHSEEDFQSLYKINVISAFSVIKVLSKKKYIPNSGMSIVLLSSMMSKVGMPGQVAYCASKSALTSSVKSLALELASRKIRINSISPGQVIDTRMSKKMFEEIPAENIQIKRNRHVLGWVETIDISNSCIFLLSSASKKITGTDILIDGGYCAQ